MRVLRTALPTLTVLTVLAACSTSGNGPTSPGPGGATRDADGTTPAAGAAAPAGNTGGPGTRPACRTEDVSVTITRQPDGTDTIQRALVAVTNTSNKTCTVGGWLSITLMNAADEPVGVPTERVEEPGPAVSVEIRPGTTAFAGIKWTVCDKSDSACGAGNTIRYHLTGTANGPAAKLDGFPAAERSDIAMKSLQIGSLQPAPQGAVAW